MIRLAALIVTAAALSGCGGCGKKEAPAPPPTRVAPTVKYATPKGSKARASGQSREGKVIYVDKNKGGRLYHVYVVNPQTKAYFITIVTPLRQEIEMYRLDNNRFPRRLDELENWKLYERQLPHNMGLQYNHQSGQLDLIRY